MTVDEEKKELDKEKHGEEIKGGTCTNVENYRNHASALPYAIIVCYRHLVVLQSLIKREAKINRNNDWRTKMIEKSGKKLENILQNIIHSQKKSVRENCPL